MPDAELVVTLSHPTLHVDEDGLERLVRHVLAAEGPPWDAIGIILADHPTVLALNRAYLDHNYLTDVLSFPLHEPGAPVAGEVYVDLDTAAERHAEFGVTFEEEVRRYVVHGLLHLLGYDDATPTEKAAMHALEDRYLASTR